MRPTPPRSLLSAGVLTAVLALSACTGDPTEDAAPPAAEVPSAVASTVVTDVGQYLVEPTQGLDRSVVDGTVAKLAASPGVQSARLNPEGFVDVVFEPGSTPEQRAAVVKQMAALGEVIEGV